MPVLSQGEMLVFKKNLYSIHQKFLKFLKLPFVELFLFEQCKKEGKFLILGQLSFHEFFKGQVEGIDIFLKNPDGSFRSEEEIISTYIHEITHYHLLMHSRPIFHGKEFEKREKFIREKFKKILENREKKQ